jgi:cell division protein FtsQ
MLTPGFRFALRAGVPFALVFGLATGYMANETRRDGINTAIQSLRASIQERPEFMVQLMAIDGASRTVSQDIREVIPLDFPISSFDLDLALIRERVTGLDPVREATVRIRPGGVLQIDVIERVPAFVWRTRDGLEILDGTGVRVDDIASRSDRFDLPLIAGEGADRHVVEAAALFAAASPLGARVRGLVRIGERRWDLVLDRGQRILLPVQRPVRALERVIALGEMDEMLDRDLMAVDMRLAERPTIRMTEHAVADWWRIRELNGSGQ